MYETMDKPENSTKNIDSVKMKEGWKIIRGDYK